MGHSFKKVLREGNDPSKYVLHVHCSKDDPNFNDGDIFFGTEHDRPMRNPDLCTKLGIDPDRLISADSVLNLNSLEFDKEYSTDDI